MLRFFTSRFQIITSFVILLIIFYLFNLENFKEKVQQALIVQESLALENILNDEPKDNKNIFLINTSDVSSGIDLQPRQACAIESAGKVKSMNLPHII